mmetsp:Transcript_10079/g.25783  ORF Transcript_10079/g.25783 Transcript_10079/m.25783 type:complete len:220 (-) Transcript_10079:550-1209(-)
MQRRGGARHAAGGSVRPLLRLALEARRRGLARVGGHRGVWLVRAAGGAAHARPRGAGGDAAVEGQAGRGGRDGDGRGRRRQGGHGGGPQGGCEVELRHGQGAEGRGAGGAGGRGGAQGRRRPRAERAGSGAHGRQGDAGVQHRAGGPKVRQPQLPRARRPWRRRLQALQRLPAALLLQPALPAHALARRAPEGVQAAEGGDLGGELSARRWVCKPRGTR